MKKFMFGLILFMLIPGVLAECDGLNVHIEINGTSHIGIPLGLGRYQADGVIVTIQGCANCTGVEASLDECLDDLDDVQNDLDDINDTLWSCGDDRCDIAWDDCDEDLNDCEDDFDSVNDTLWECGKERCDVAWDDCSDDLKFANTTLWSCDNTRCDTYYTSTRNCVSERDLCNDNLANCRNDKSNLEILYNSVKNRPERCNETVCMDCNSILTQFQNSIGYNRTLGIVPCPNIECEDGSCLIWQILGGAMAFMAIVIIVSNIINLRKEKGSSSPPQKHVEDETKDIFEWR